MKQIKISPIALFLGFLGILLLVGCSGGSGTGPTTSTTTDSGTVALFLKDGPIDDFEEILVTITRVALIPEEEDAEQVVIFESEEGEKVDLLSYRDEPYLFLVDNTIPTGRYAKIRLWISDVQPVGPVGDDVPCEDMEIKLPSGKIDLNPRGGFEVVPGEALAIELDLDLDKSIQMKEAGNSGKCIFRPVIFVNIYDHPAFMPTCPRIISGTINTLIYDDDDTLVVGFGMLLANGANEKPPIAVMIEQAVVFDGSGNTVEPDTLRVNDEVNVRGGLNSEGVLDATLVVVGDVAMVSGVALSSVNPTDGIFQLDPDENQVVVDSEDPLNVYVAPKTFVMIGCDDEVDPTAIHEGMEALVIGKINTEGLFLAVVVVLRPEEISGSLLNIVPEAGGSQLTLNVNTDGTAIEEVHIFLPGGVPPHIKGDGYLPLGLLTEIVTCDKRPQVEIKLEPGEFNIAAKLAVIPFELSGTVVAVSDPTDDLITLDVADTDDDRIVQVYAYATILDENGSLVGIEGIEVGDTIISHGIESCEEGVTQLSFVISVQEDPVVVPI